MSTPNMTQTRLSSIHNLFINGLVVLGSRVVLDFATPNLLLKSCTQNYTWKGCALLLFGGLFFVVLR